MSRLRFSHVDVEPGASAADGGGVHKVALGRRGPVGDGDEVDGLILDALGLNVLAKRVTAGRRGVRLPRMGETRSSSP